jgi:Rhodopirellula transposase DDE domain
MISWMHDAAAIERILRKFQTLTVFMDERMRRQWAATEAMELGWGGISQVAKATGISRTTILAGVRELKIQEATGASPTPNVRRAGGGRKLLVETDPELWNALDALVDPLTRGHPETPLRWTCKSTRQLAAELTRQNHPISDRTVASLLYAAGYSLQANRKTREGKDHPDRNAQFEYISQQVRRVQKRGQPVVSVDTKKKELVGDFKNPGQEWRPKKNPQTVRTHDFPDPDLGKAIPYGVYDLANNQGWVSVGIDHDTAEFAANSIGRWFEEMGSERFPRACELLITADGGGSNGYRTRMWKVALQRLADRLGLKLKICHFPPGTSKWNKIEHRLFSYITSNWRGKPLVSHEAIVNLIASTTTTTGLIVRSALDTNAYETGIKVSDEELANLRLTPCNFHGEWNYTIVPHKKQN